MIKNEKPENKNLSAVPFIFLIQWFSGQKLIWKFSCYFKFAIWPECGKIGKAKRIRKFYGLE
jgi:hypothetical protein